MKSMRSVHRADIDERLHRVTGNARPGVALGTVIGTMMGVAPRAMTVDTVRKAQAPFLAAWVVTDMHMANGRIVG